jgi:hypothetical protein
VIRALQKRPDWPMFDDRERATRGSQLASSLMGYQKPND